MKKIKVFHMGKRLKDIYPHATRFQVFKYKVAQFVRKLFKVSLIGGAVYGAFILGGYATPLHFVQGESTDSLPAKIEVLKNEVVESIWKLESNASTEDGIVVIDDNKAKSLPRKDKLSYGCMQFKVSTVQHFQKVVYQKDVNNYDAIMIALDCQKAKEFAKDVIFKTQGGLWDWSVATKEMGMKVEIIKSLEK